MSECVQTASLSRTQIHSSSLGRSPSRDLQPHPPAPILALISPWDKGRVPGGGEDHYLGCLSNSAIPGRESKPTRAEMVHRYDMAVLSKAWPDCCFKWDPNPLLLMRRSLPVRTSSHPCLCSMAKRVLISLGQSACEVGQVAMLTVWASQPVQPVGFREFKLIGS